MLSPPKRDRIRVIPHRKAAPVALDPHAQLKVSGTLSSVQSLEDKSMQTLFTVLITIEFLIAALHDLIHIPGWAHGRQVKAALGKRKMVIGTITNAIPPGLALAFAFYYFNKPKPTGVIDYWAIYNGIALVSAI